MPDFKKFGNKRGDTFNRGPGGKPGFGGGDRADRPMYKAVCAECGKPCEVPFRPSGDRPVYCKDCFAAMGPQERSDSRGPSAPRRDFSPRAPFPARPSVAFGGGGQGSGEDKRLDDLKIQLATVISKLDKLINLQTNTSHTTPKVASSGKSETLHDTLAKAGAAPAKAKVSKKKASSKKK